MYYTSSVDIYYIHEWMNGINKNYEIRILKRGWRNKKSPFFFFFEKHRIHGGVVALA